MLKLRETLLLSLLAVAGSASAQSILTTATYNGHTYSLLSNTNWSDAEAFAVSMGDHLVTIDDAAEDAFVSSAFGSFGGVNRNLWIGLNDAATEGTFVWSSGSSSAYRNWNPNQPDNYPNSATGEDYVQIFAPVTSYTPGKWNDAPDSANLFFAGDVYGVVETVPEPAPVAALSIGAIALLRRRRKD